MSLRDLAGTKWQGTAELWLDPLGNQAHESACTLHVEPTELHYAWSHEGRPHSGSVTIGPSGGQFTDTWHQPQPMVCGATSEPRGLIDLLGSYGDGEGPRWGWRIVVSLRPTFMGEPECLVLQMTNIAPWGEEARAVRMVGQRCA